MKIVNEIKATKQLSLKTYLLSSFLISNRISPYISSLYIKLGVIPNTITIHMILSGILGAFFFTLPNVGLKIIGAGLIHLWFILDCSDGEVARYTKRYSKYGKELDFMAHLINHPLFGISFGISLLQLGRYDVNIIIFLIMLSNLLDYLNRNLFTLKLAVDARINIDNKGYMPKADKWSIKKVILFITNIFTVYPNLVLFGVLVYFVDYFIGTNILYNYIIVNILLTAVFSIRSLIIFTKKFYNS